jgi:hypothetical protein
MPSSPDYRLYIESRIEGLGKLINAQFENVHDKLESIETQTKRTNGTVQEHDRIIKDNLPHTIAKCPQQNVIQEIRDNMIKTEDITKYKAKKNSMLIAIISLLIAIASIVTSAIVPRCSENRKWEKDLKAQQEKGYSSTERGGFVHYGDSSVIKDTLK